MTLDEAMEAVRQTLPNDQRLRIDHKLARQDDTAYLLIVLDARRQFDDGDVPIENGPRLITKTSGVVSRLTVPEAVARTANLALVRP
ncbi:MAG: hypothetical protein QM650_01650 [Microlunatus sp.]